ncbi:MAG: DegT/DnrJ/EryC1/StrS aminotransferase family protein, partial [Actinomycetota bacterium]
MEKQKYIEMNNFIPVNEPLISDESKKYVNIALDTGWISSAGVFVDKFEKDFAKFLGIKYAIAVSSGTAALHVALLAAGLGKNDEVIVPAFTMAATWLAVLYVGAKPIFIDCESDTFNINPTLIEEKITKRTKAIIPVHVYGHSADMDPILKIARKHKLIVIEDAAEAHGATYKGKFCGSMGSISCFSFYGNKIITTGEGGMVVTNNQNLAKRARRFKDLCHSERKRFIHDDIGYNYRITNLQAALGCGELRKINMYIERKINMAKAYKIGLSDIPGITTPIIKNYAKCVY